MRAAFVHALSQRFPLDDKGALTWVLGTRVEYKRDHRRLMLSQELYTTDLLRRHAPHVDSTARRYDSPMAEDAALSSDQCPSADSQEHTDMRPFRDVYMQIVGGLLWLAACTRPDITYAASTLARFVSNPARAHYAAMQRVLAYLKHTAARVLLIQKKMIILHKGTEEHRKLRTSAPQGEPGPPPTVLTPQSPCTATRAVGVGTL